MLIAAARRNGVSAYVGDGANRWPAIHRLDAAALFRLALEQAPAGTAVHGAAESAITMATIAQRVGELLGLPVVSLSLEAAADHFESPFIAAAFGTDAPASSARTRECCSAGRPPIRRCSPTSSTVTTSRRPSA